MKIIKIDFLAYFDEVPENFLGPLFRSGLVIGLMKSLAPGDYQRIVNSSPEGDILQKYSYTPKGFALDLPFVNSEATPFSVLLFGKTDAHRDAFIKAVEFFSAASGINISYQGMQEVPETQNPWCDEFQIVFETPTDIRYGGMSWGSPEFHVLLRSALRRKFLLSYCYAEEYLPLEENLLKAASAVDLTFSVMRNVRFNRQSTRSGVVPMRGKVGTCRYRFRNNIPQDMRKRLLEIIRFAELAHIGKNTVFGFGKIKIQFGGFHVQKQYPVNRRDNDYTLATV